MSRRRIVGFVAPLTLLLLAVRNPARRKRPQVRTTAESIDSRV